MKQVQNTLLASGKKVPCTKLCAWLGLPRSTAYHQPRQRRSKPLDEVMAARIKQIHKQESSCGVRGTWSRLRHEQGIPVNIKKVHRIMKLKGWTLPKRRAGNRPRVKITSSIA
jgi:putative transposase